MLLNMEVITASNSSGSNGFVMYASTPARKPSTRSALWSFAVRNMMGTRAVRGDERIRETIAYPSIPGMRMSLIIKSGTDSARLTSASAPLRAVTTS
jgi:hypothetical protein